MFEKVNPAHPDKVADRIAGALVDLAYSVTLPDVTDPTLRIYCYCRDASIAIYDQVLSRSLDTTALESELSDLEAEINIAAELIEDCIKENAHVALDQDEYQKRYDALVARFDEAKARHTEVTDLIAERMARKHQIEAYLKNLRSREPLTEFRETDWLAMVDYIAVHSKNDIRVTFKDGTEIKA